MSIAEKVDETTKWLNVNNHVCNPWEMKKSLSRTLKSCYWKVSNVLVGHILLLCRELVLDKKYLHPRKIPSLYISETGAKKGLKIICNDYK
jgi:hypothetical protein